LSLTPGIGASRGRKLVELFDGIDRLCNASLMGLEAAGLPAASAQNLGLGKSLELAGDELDRVKALGARIVALDDLEYPTGSARFTTLRSCSTSQGVRKSLTSRDLPSLAPAIGPRMRWELRSGWLATWQENQKLADQILASASSAECRSGFWSLRPASTAQPG